MVQIEENEYRRLMQLDRAVRKMVTQRGDDLCWRDIYTELAALVGVDFCPALICPPEKFLSNCAAFEKSLREGGRYTPLYAEANDPIGVRP